MLFRSDSGVYSGWEVPVHYDSLLAKLIVHAPDRATACARLSQALTDCAYLGIPTNVDFLRRLVDDPDFRAGHLRTDFLNRKPAIAKPEAAPTDDLALAAAALVQALGSGGPATSSANASAAGATVRGTTAVWGELAGLRLWGEQR